MLQNQLDRFDVDVSKHVYLSILNLGYNNIKFLHESVWRHKTLAILWLNSNMGLGLPLDSSKIKMPQLPIINSIGIIKFSPIVILKSTPPLSTN